MSKYIDAEVYEKKLDKYCDANCKYTEKERYVMCDACELGIAFEILEGTPTADVRENVRGKWVERECGEEEKDEGWETVIVCSHCDFPATTFYSEDCNSRTQIRTRFCPNCGADMRGEKDG